MKQNNNELARREFLKAAGVVGLGAATLPVFVSNEAPARESPGEQIQSRYRLNEHVKRFYFLNRL